MPAPGGNPYSPCGELARQAAEVVRHLTPLVGPCPPKSIQIGVYSQGQVDPFPFAAASSPRRIDVPENVALSAAHTEFFPGVLPFEVAHIWFPDTDADAGRYNPRFVEIMAVYLAWRYLLETNPEAARVMAAQALRDSVAQTLPHSLSFAIDKFPSPGLVPRAALDRRGLLVMRTLETVIDRERVDRAIPEFIRRYDGHPASVADFQRVCENIAGRKLDWFFRYFFDGTQIPTIELRRLPSETPGVAAGELIVKGLPPEGSVRVEMAVRTAQGVVEHSVATRGEATPFTVNVPAPALGITLDPDMRILRWTEAAERSKAQSAVLDGLPEPITRGNLAAAIDIYRRAIAADAGDASRRAQSLDERLGELEWANDEWNAALADLEAAINGHSLGAFETYLCRGKAYLYHGVVQLHQRRPKEALEDARAGMAMPREVLAQILPERPLESHESQTLERLLQILVEAATHY